MFTTRSELTACCAPASQHSLMKSRCVLACLLEQDCVEHFQALGGLLVAEAHAVQELASPR